MNPPLVTRDEPTDKWSRWQEYQEMGMAYERWGNLADGQARPYAEVRQKRVCEKCGKTQDEWIKSGPLEKK